MKFSKSAFKAKTGFEAVVVCCKNPDIDLILMDIRMPEMNGYGAIRQIRKTALVLGFISLNAFSTIPVYSIMSLYFLYTKTKYA